jgi:putative hydrolase of the HAD superfamily
LVVVFDLDDTLYDEMTYVKSGFKAVAQYVGKEFNLSKKILFKQLVAALEDGRGTIFDAVLKRNNIYTKKTVKKCLSIYRNHKPDIKLSKEGRDCLLRFKDYPLYIVTDGNKLVQYNKIKALKIEKLVKFYFITHRYGKGCSKPSPYCFNKICKKEGVTPENVVYIGDNVTKDFVGIKPLGFRTIHILTGQYSDIKRPDSYQADMKISSLNELTKEILHNFNV